MKNGEREETSEYIYPVLGGTFALKLDSAVASPQLPLPALLGRDDADAFLLARDEHAPGLPPLVVRRVRHVKDVAVAKVETPARQPVVLVGVVVEQSPGKQRQIAPRHLTSLDFTAVIMRNCAIQRLVHCIATNCQV